MNVYDDNDSRIWSEIGFLLFELQLYLHVSVLEAEVN